MPVNSLSSERPIDLCVIVVLYQSSVSASATCLSLSNQRFIESRDTFLVYDNSPYSDLGPIPTGWEVIMDSNNGGLSAAYQCGVTRAKAAACPWVLLLDQDTELPPDFLATLHENLVQLQGKTEVVAIVPIVKAGRRQLSPMLPRIGRENPFEFQDVVVTKWLMAINSGTCLRVDFIESIGGFSKAFWLDYLDHWLFKMINNEHKSIYVSSTVLQHELSVADMNRGLSVERYKNVLRAERQFTNGYLPQIWRLALIPRLLARALKHLVVTHDKRLGFLMAASAATQMGSLIRVCWLSLSTASRPTVPK
jgi:glycosyltransferase involved in cell wall biosynthesis